MELDESRLRVQHQDGLAELVVRAPELFVPSAYLVTARAPARAQSREEPVREVLQRDASQPKNGFHRVLEREQVAPAKLQAVGQKEVRHIRVGTHVAVVERAWGRQRRHSVSSTRSAGVTNKDAMGHTWILV